MNSLDKWTAIQSAWESRQQFDAMVEENFVVADRLIGFPTQELSALYLKVDQVFDQFWQEYKLITLNAREFIPENRISESLRAKADVVNQAILEFCRQTKLLSPLEIQRAKADAANNFIEKANQNTAAFRNLLQRSEILNLLAQEPSIGNIATEVLNLSSSFDQAQDWSAKVLMASRLNGAYMRLDRAINENLDVMFKSMGLNNL